jgi:hypothetical protein
MISRSVIVDTVSTEVNYYDRFGKLQVLGEIIRDDFQGESVRKFAFRPVADNPYVRSRKRDDNELIKLGREIGSDRLDFVQYSTAQQMFLDHGLEIVDQYGTNGGTEMTTVFRNPTIELPNIYDYDRKLWAGRASIGNTMFHAIELTTSIAVGKMAIKAREGIYVLVCTNGNMAKVLELPSISFAHIGFDLSYAQKRIDAMGFGTRDIAMLRGPEVASKQMLNAAHNAISHFLSQREADKKFSVKSDSPFYAFDRKNMSRRLLGAYLEHLSAVIDNDSKIVYAGDVVNSYTSAVNRMRNEWHDDDDLSGTWQGFKNTDAATSQTVQLARLAGMFLDIESAFKTFDVNAEPVEDENLLAELA